MSQCFCEKSKGKSTAMVVAQQGRHTMILSRDRVGMYIEARDGGVLYYPEFCPLCGSRLRESIRDLMIGDEDG